MKKLPVPTTCATCQDFSYCGEKDVLTLAPCEYYVKAYARYKEVKTVALQAAPSSAPETKSEVEK